MFKHAVVMTSASFAVMACLTGCTPTPAPPVSAAPGDIPTGAGTDWTNAVAACPNDGQKPIVQKVVGADVTGDGIDDIVVGRTCEAFTSYWPSTVEIFDKTKGPTPVRIGTVLGESVGTDNPWLTGLAVNSGVIVVNANGAGPGAANACPNLELTYTYKFEGTRFKRLSRTATTSKTCLPAG